jgi:DNA-directed RNA polymerase subunit K/omega
MKSAEYNKAKINPFAVTRDVRAFDKETNNLYKTVSIIAKRSNQIAQELKEEFHERAQEFATVNDTLDEMYENKEQIELARYFEQLPKPTLLAVHEFEHGQVFFKDTEK